MINIEQYILSLDLKRSRLKGEEYIACCPFHSDKHPSFAINIKTGKWNCLAASCMLTGDIARFIYLYENKTWAEVYQILGGVGVPQSIAEIEALLNKEKTVIPHTNYPEYKEPWFLKPLDNATLKKFNPLLSVGDVKKFGIQQIVGGQWRGCLYCPMWGMDGKVISYTIKLSKAHGGRWWHPPDSPNKSMLYGANFVLGMEKVNWVFVVEGLWDKINLERLGWSTGVAVQGIRIHDEQLPEIKALAQYHNANVCVMFDRGTEESMEKVVAELWSVGVKGYAFDYQDIQAKDPGEFVEADAVKIQDFIDKIENNT